MPPTRPLLLEPTLHLGPSASSALQASFGPGKIFGPGQITRHGSF